MMLYVMRCMWFGIVKNFRLRIVNKQPVSVFGTEAVNPGVRYTCASRSITKPA